MSPENQTFQITKQGRYEDLLTKTELNRKALTLEPLSCAILKKLK
jgi:hypothetical protein